MGGRHIAARECRGGIVPPARRKYTQIHESRGTISPPAPRNANVTMEGRLLPPAPRNTNVTMGGRHIAARTLKIHPNP